MSKSSPMAGPQSRATAPSRRNANIPSALPKPAAKSSPFRPAVSSIRWQAGRQREEKVFQHRSRHFRRDEAPLFRPSGGCRAGGPTLGAAKRWQITNCMNCCCISFCPARYQEAGQGIAEPFRLVFRGARRLPRATGGDPGARCGLNYQSQGHAALGQRYGRDQIHREKPIQASWSQSIDYCRSQMAHETIEQFHILLADKKNRLIAGEVQQGHHQSHPGLSPRSDPPHAGIVSHRAEPSAQPVQIS